MSHDRAIELIDAARVALNAYLDVETATIETDVWELLRKRALPVVVPDREIEGVVGTFFDEMTDLRADHPVSVNGRFCVGFLNGDEDAGDYTDVDYRTAFATRDDCERFLVARELSFRLEAMAEQVAPDMPEPEFEDLLNRLGHGDLTAYREAMVGRVERSAA